MKAPADPDPQDGLDFRVADLSQSPTLASQERAAVMAARGARVFRLGLGQSPFPVPLPVVEALRAHAGEKDYLPVRGLPELRRAVTHYHRRRFGVQRAPADVIVGPGSKELMFLLLFCFDGELLISAPAWVSYAPQARLAGRRLTLLHTRREDDFKLRSELLDAYCTQEPRGRRLLVLNYPSNPTGATYNATELLALADVCRKHGVVVLSDEIYGELHYQGQHVSLAAHYEEGTILSGGLSKWCGAGGWRLGAFNVPAQLRWLADAMAAVGSETFSATSAPIQYAAVQAFTGGPEIEDYLVQSRRILAGLTGWAATLLRNRGVDVVQPAAGFYLFVDFGPLRERLASRQIHTDRLLSTRLLEDCGITTLPGSAFGMPDGTLFLRLALVDFDGARALASPHDAVVDEAFVHRYCAPTHEALHLIAAWIDAN